MLHGAFPDSLIDRVAEAPPLKFDPCVEDLEVFDLDKARYARNVYGTDRLDHPGGRMAESDPRTKLLGGHLSIVDNLERTGVEVRVSIPLKGSGGGAAPVAPSTQTLQ